MNSIWRVEKKEFLRKTEDNDFLKEIQNENLRSFYKIRRIFGKQNRDFLGKNRKKETKIRLVEENG